jgi:hypothetical protein
METSVKAGKGRVVVSVGHPATMPGFSVQRRATREFEKYRTPNQLWSARALTVRRTHEGNGQTALTDYTYVQMRQEAYD